MGIALAFFLGIANFLAQSVVLNSRHPVLSGLSPERFRLARRASLALEFALLVAVMLASRAGPGAWLVFYAFYTLGNGAAAWMIWRSV
ncbi:hypothetical protein [Aurantiacibacter suaedae]|uniref:hypothetical protein n=1 Tax=Aurantiacibacter suaedae TaxID=2545755 RepID=UPI0010F6975A|nr:hypothetical protein [Aurantiacibacter suaedae]